MSTHFAVDLGAESGRCMAGFLENGTLRLEEIRRFPTKGLKIRGEWYWNLYRFYEEILEGLKEYVRRCGPCLDSIGVDTWGVDYCLLDHMGRIEAIPKCYRRMTSEHPYEVMEETLGRRTVYEHTGIQFLVFNTLNQFIQEMENDPGYLDKNGGFLFIGDSLHYLLGARPACEYTAASISQLVDTRSQDWDSEIFQAFSLPDSLKTPLVFAGDVIGELSEEICQATGLQPGVKIVTPAVHDTASASVAIPASGENWGFISSGTWSLAGLELSSPLNTPESYRFNVSNSAGVLGKSLFLKNIMGLWIIQQCRQEWLKLIPDLTYDQIVKLAKKAMPFAAFIQPDDNRFFAPDNMLDAISSYLEESGQNPGCKISISKDMSQKEQMEAIGQTARIVYESLALQYRRIFDTLTDISGRHLEVLHITGGGSNNKMLNQFTANALGVTVIAGPSECSASGNLLMQAYGCHQVPDLPSIRRIVQTSFPLAQYVPDEKESWEQAYIRYQKLCPME